MLSSDVSYQQSVRISGYAWQTVRHPRTGRDAAAIVGDPVIEDPCWVDQWDELLCAVDSASRGTAKEAGHRTYSVDDVPDLYRQFGRLLMSREDIARFAGSYGLLGLGESVVLEDESSAGTDGQVRRMVEFGGDWAREISTMNRALVVLDALDENLGPDAEELARSFNYTCGSWHVCAEMLPAYTGQGRAQWIDLCIWAEESGVFGAIDAENIERAAFEFLRVLANLQMERRVSAYAAWDDVETKTVLSYKPNCLLGAMWLQFSRALTRTENSRVCIECGKLFEYVRKSRLFCSEACQKRYSRRKAKHSSAEQSAT